MLVLMIIFTTIPSTSLAEPAVHNDQSDNNSPERVEQNVNKPSEEILKEDDEDGQESVPDSEENKENVNDSSETEVPIESVDEPRSEERRVGKVCRWWVLVES